MQGATVKVAAMVEAAMEAAAVAVVRVAVVRAAVVGVVVVGVAVAKAVARAVGLLAAGVFGEETEVEMVAVGLEEAMAAAGQGSDGA